MLYTLNVAMAFAFLSSLYGDFMQVGLDYSSNLNHFPFPLQSIVVLPFGLTLIAFHRDNAHMQHFHSTIAGSLRCPRGHCN